MLTHKAKEPAPHIVLANNNPDECQLFKDALETLKIPCNVSVFQKWGNTS